MWRKGMEGGLSARPQPAGRCLAWQIWLAWIVEDGDRCIGSLFCTLGFTKRSCQRLNTVLDTPALA